ncbi:hypothetical protein PGT21_031922 [Puccinia graminis f. sp. tritici]|uniref:FAS1 domain-containing protein n=2 Tax=Puccinia graminis f. sp. tritici TaxID=56615 RepID=E3K6C0_PUCGT|nr:uncharacterized protein PGTG_05076 [Puccinia graminis f. sp. tritici CRL 75-36-700-3]EFP79851.1 hypothetical protein PGTG_05076 [Puccinia graminis f. sp. tritici CRL 75-36-700-3]KAA1076004.1 hypothetical protein PGTUg99_032947 [Puccinia graminis f. sp. tritici]KAA1091354.1 hypothetical protein PGT21_031922 [Puccinia graminis f. sp. tritici]
MSAFTSLSGALLLALSLNHVSAQVPANVSPCVRNCATVKVSEGYCSNPQIFSTAYDQCLRQNCNGGDIAAGLALTPAVVCATANPPPTAPGTATPAPLPVTAGNATGTPVPAGNSTGAIPNALRAAGAGTLATLIGSPAGQSYASELQQGPHTVFAPVDSALAQLPLNSTSPADLTALLNYHTVPGTVDVARLPPTGHAIVRTALRGAPHVNLPANDSQVLVLAAQPNGVLTIIEPTRNITVSNATRADNLEIAGIPNALTIPGTIAATAAAIPELSSLIAAVNGSAPQLFQQLDQTPGLTIFAPINAALANPPPNTNLPGILVNHIVNGTVLYSTTIANVTNATSAGGSHIDFINNGTGTYARSGEKTLLIVQSDIITRNGVIHLVNGLFDPSTATPTFPLPNQNNATETAGITQVEGANLTTAAQNAQQSSALRSVSSPGSLVAVFAMLLVGAFVL